MCLTQHKHQAMKKILIISLLLTTTLAFGQQGSFQLGLTLAEDNISGSRFITAHGNANGYVIERSEYNYSIGFSANYGLSEKLSVLSGINYSNKDVKGAYSCASCFYPADIIIITNYVVAPTLQKQRYLGYALASSLATVVVPSLQKQRYLGIPMAVQFSPLATRLQPTVSAGVVNNILLQNDFESQKGYFLEGQIGFGLNYNISQKLNLGLNYNFRSAFTAIYKEPEGGYAFNDSNKLETNSYSFNLSYKLK